MKSKNANWNIQGGQPEPSNRSNSELKDLREASQRAESLDIYQGHYNTTITPIPFRSTRLRKLPGPIKQSLGQPPNIDFKGQQDNEKEVHINLLNEYKHHLKCMDKLDQFKSMKFGWDHCFYKSVVRQFFNQETLEREKQCAKEKLNTKLTAEDLIEVAEELIKED